VKVTPRAIPAALRSAVLDTLHALERRDRAAWERIDCYGPVPAPPTVERIIRSGGITRRLGGRFTMSEPLVLWRRADRLTRIRAVRRILREAGRL